MMSHIKLPIIDSLTLTLQNRPSNSKSQYPRIFSDCFSKISEIHKFYNIFNFFIREYLYNHLLT